MEQEIKELIHFLSETNQKYRLGEEVISDTEYNEKLERLREIDPNHEFFQKGIVTDISDERFGRIRQERLPIEMRSLDKLKSIDEILLWIENKGLPSNTELVITPKYDGISILCDEFLHKYWTSGDGFVGQDVSEHLSMSYVPNKMPKYICNPNMYFSIGELIIPKKNWTNTFEGQLNPRSKKPFKSARNTVAGMMNNDDPNSIGNYLKECYYLPYTLAVLNEDLISYWTDKSVQLEHLYGESIKISVPSIHINADLLTEKLLNVQFEQWSQDFVIDGLVIDIEDGRLRRKCGFESNSNPGFARAYKDVKWSETAETEIVDIKIQISKLGTATPVLEIKPVDLSGATITNVNGINAQYCFDWKLGIGQKITITRSGEVIPKIIAVNNCTIPFRENYTSNKLYLKEYQDAVFKFNQKINSSNNLDHYRNIKESISKVFYKCYSCKNDLIWNKSHIDKCCINVDCKEKTIQQNLFFCSIFEIRDLGIKTILSLYEIGLKNPRQIVESSISNFLSLEGFQIKSAQKLVRQFQKLELKGYNFSKLSYGLGLFEDLGEKTIQTILNGLQIQSFVDLNRFELSSNKIEELCVISGISIEKAVKFSSNLGSAIKLLSKDWNVNEFADEKLEVTEGPLLNQSFVFSQFRDKELKKRIEDLAGKVPETLTKSITHLVVIDKSKITGKVTKARSYGVAILDKSELEKLIKSYE